MGLAPQRPVAVWLTASVWGLLLLGGALTAWLGVEAARLVAYAACAALVVWARPRARVRASSFAPLLAGAAGCAALPAWLALVFGIGSGLGLAPPAPRAAPPDACAWLANGVLAPLFEELLYRERVLPALRARLGAPLALLLSSAVFAAPHLEPWSVLTTFCVGLVLGGVFLATGRIGPCLGYHAGLNAAALAWGLPPARAALAPLDAAFVGTLLLVLACVWTRGHDARPRVHFPGAPASCARCHEARGLQPDRACRRSASDS